MGPANLEKAKHSSLKLNAFSNWIALVVNIMVGFFLTPAIYGHLGGKRYGMWTLLSSVVGYFGILNLGVGTGVLRYVPLFRGKGNQQAVNAVISTSAAFNVTAGLLILILSWSLSGLIADFFQGGAEFATVLRILGLAAALQCPSLIFDAAIKGYERFFIANLITIGSTILRAAALFGCILMGYGLVPMAWTLAILTLLVLISKGIALKLFCKDVHVRINQVGFAELRMLVCFGFLVLVVSGGQTLTYDVPKAIIGRTVSLEAVGLFGIVALLVSYCRRSIYALTRVFLPRFSYLSGQGAENEIRRLFLRASKYMTIISGGICLPLWVIGPSFLRLWIRTNNINQAIPALLILAPGTLVFLSHHISVDTLFGLGQQTKVALLAMIEGISVFILSLALSYKYGINGVALGISVAFILVRGIIQPIYVCSFLKLSFWKYHADCIIRPWIIAITLAVVGWRLGVADFANNWLLLFTASGLTMLTYATAIYMVGIGSQERLRIKSVCWRLLKTN